MRLIKKIKLIPEIKINTDHEKRVNKVWPISGCKASKNTTNKVTIKEIRYLKYILPSLLLLKMKLKNTIKKGFTNSIGWNLGIKYKSIHLLDPFTSIPIRGTKNKRIIDATKKMIEIFKRFSWLIDEKIKIKKTPINKKIKCLKKKR